MADSSTETMGPRQSNGIGDETGLLDWPSFQSPRHGQVDHPLHRASAARTDCAVGGCGGHRRGAGAGPLDGGALETHGAFSRWAQTDAGGDECAVAFFWIRTSWCTPKTLRPARITTAFASRIPCRPDRATLLTIRSTDTRPNATSAGRLASCPTRARSLVSRRRFQRPVPGAATTDLRPRTRLRR